jgi:NitT/TauT family transport system permease protein
MNRTLLRRLLLPPLSFAAVIVAWQLVCVLSGWNESVFPRPIRTFQSLWELCVTGELIRHAVASVFRVTVGYYLSVITAIPLGMALGWWKGSQSAVNALIQFLRPISPLAWIPLAMLWFGLGDPPAIFLIFLSSFFPLLVSTIDAVNQVNATYFRVAANFDFSRQEVFLKVIFPAILPSVIPAMRISLGVAWLVVVAAEMIAVKSGLGYLILDARNALRMDRVIGAMITIGLIGIGLDFVVRRLARFESLAWGLRRS